jgi:hypothetical protein
MPKLSFPALRSPSTGEPELFSFTRSVLAGLLPVHIFGQGNLYMPRFPFPKLVVKKSHSYPHPPHPAPFFSGRPNPAPPQPRMVLFIMLVVKRFIKLFTKKQSGFPYWKRTITNFPAKAAEDFTFSNDRGDTLRSGDLMLINTKYSIKTKSFPVTEIFSPVEGLYIISFMVILVFLNSGLSGSRKVRKE